MNSLNIKMKSDCKDKIVKVEMDADKLERMAASFGFLNDDFIKSVDRAEKDYKNGRIKEIKSLASII